MSFRYAYHLGLNSSLWRNLRQQLLPNYCAICKNQSENLICVQCQKEFFPNQNYRCPCCAIPIPASAPASNHLCGECLKKRPTFDRTIVACNYLPPIDHLVLALKFGHQLGLAKAFAKELRNQISNMSQEALPDLICPIPLGAQRLVARGFNQSLEIAKPLGNDLGIPVRHNLLLRLRDTLQQSSLHPDARHKNVRNAFTVNPEMCSLIQGRHVAIVDDVITTGTTLNEAAKVLKRFGASKVSNFVFARTIWL
jgi:ComF family protein